MELKRLIGETSLASIATWADDYKFTEEGKGTYAWQFVDIDIAKPAYSDSDYKKTDEKTCIVKGLPIANLRDKSRPQSERLVALRLIVHLVGDLEQPLHNSAQGDDGGGNTLFVSFKATRSHGKSYRRSSTFHSMWDDSLIELQAYSWGSYADAIDARPLPAVEGAPYDEARVAAWSNDSHALGTKAYQLLPPATPVNSEAFHPLEVGDAYATAVKPDLDTSMAKAPLASKPSWKTCSSNPPLKRAPKPMYQRRANNPFSALVVEEHEGVQQAMWALFVAIGDYWNLGDDPDSYRGRFTTFMENRISLNPLYREFYAGAKSLLDRLIADHGAARAYEIVFTQRDRKQPLAVPETELEFIQLYVADEFIALRLALGGFKAFGATNYCGYFGGANIPGQPVPYRTF